MKSKTTRIILLIAMVCATLVSNAQIQSSVSNDEMFKIVGKVCVSGPTNGYNVIRDLADSTYTIRFTPCNQFEGSYVMFQLGKGKEESINTWNEFMKLVEKCYKNPIHFTDAAGHELTLVSMRDPSAFGMKVWYIDQKGVAKGSDGYCSRIYYKSHFTKLIEIIEKDK